MSYRIHGMAMLWSIIRSMSKRDGLRRRDWLGYALWVKPNCALCITVSVTSWVVLVVSLINSCWADILSPLMRDHIATSRQLVKIISHSLHWDFLCTYLWKWIGMKSIWRFEPLLFLINGGSSGCFFHILSHSAMTVGVLLGN